MELSGRRLLVSDFALSFMWVWSSVLIKVLVYQILDFHKDDTRGEILKHGFSIINMFTFAYLQKITKGAAYNPLTVLSAAVSGDFSQFLFTVGGRIPVQVLGSIVAVRMILDTFPAIGSGPKLNVEIHHGALTEGVLAFMIVIISLSLSRNMDGSFIRKTWISSLSKLSLHILGSELTGGCMNPASVIGWAFARGEHLTKEHILVYWLAPTVATLLAVWIFKLVFPAPQSVKAKKKTEKSD